MLLLHGRHKAEMILRSTGKYAEVIRKRKLKKCGTLNSKVRKKSDLYLFNESMQNASTLLSKPVPENMADFTFLHIGILGFQMIDIL